MLHFQDETELAKYGLMLDPTDSTRAVPIGQLADGQQGVTATNGLPGDAVPAGSDPSAKTEKAQAAPFDLAARLDRIVGLQGRALKHDRFRTLLYCRSGLELIEIKKAFKKLGRRDFCAATERHGIQPWFRKRAMQIARHFKTEEACKGIRLLEALRMSKRQPAAKSRVTKAGRNGRPSETPAPRSASSPASAGGTAGDTPAAGSVAGEPNTANLHETASVDVAVSQEAVEAAAKLVEAAGGCQQAAIAVVMQGVKDGDKESVKNVLRGVLTAARSVLAWIDINEVVRAAELRANGAKVQEV